MDRTFTTSEGRVLEFNIVSQALLQKIRIAVRKEFEAKGEPLEIPSYWSVEPGPDGTGGEKIYWTADDVAKDGTAEEQATWKAHEDAVSRLESEQQKRITKTLLLRGLKPEDRIPPPEWVREQEELGLELPQTPKELSLEYIQIEILKTPSDIGGAFTKLTLISMGGVFSEEDREAVEASFLRGLVEIGKRAAAGLEGSPTKPKEEAEQVRDMVLPSEITTTQNGQSLGVETVSVG